VDDSDKVGGLWRYYEEQAAQARQHENLRATVTSTLAGISAAVVALAGVGGLSESDIPAGVAVIILSALGVALSLKHYERNRFHTAIMGKVREEIDEMLFVGSVVRTTGQLRSDASEGNENDHPRLSKVRLHILWLGLPVGIGIVGFLVILLSVIGIQAPT